MNSRSGQKIYFQTEATSEFYGKRTVYCITRDEWGNEQGTIKAKNGGKLKVTRLAGSDNNTWYA